MNSGPTIIFPSGPTTCTSRSSSTDDGSSDTITASLETDDEDAILEEDGACDTMDEAGSDEDSPLSAPPPVEMVATPIPINNGTASVSTTAAAF